MVLLWLGTVPDCIQALTLQAKTSLPAADAGNGIVSPPRSDLIGRACNVALALALGYAVFVAAYRINFPGLYYDETLYRPASFLALGECGNFAAVSKHLGECFPLFLQPFFPVL
jgi:hypothetical protein